MQFDIVTLFPGMFSPLEESIVGRARKRELVEIGVHDIREFTTDRHRTADDAPYGGGAGMVMKPEPIVEAVEYVDRLRGGRSGPVILLSPQGDRFDQARAEALAGEERITLVCGHYEGVDERVRRLVITDELSIGDYVLTGGELAAMVVVDAVVRLLPGVLGNDEGAWDDSFATGLLEYPQYTRPQEYRGLAVPEILLSGHHEEVRRWRRKESLRRTLLRRPDLLERAPLTEEDRRLLAEIDAEKGEEQG